MVDEPSIVKELREKENKGFLKDVSKKNSVDFFRLAVDNSLDSVFVINCKKMVFVDVNKTACKSTGYSREELLGMGPQDIKPEFTIKQLREKFDTVLKSRGKKGLIETVHKRKDGSTFPVEVFLSCLKDEDVIIASVRDVSERKKNKKKLAETEKEYKLLIESLNEGVWKINENSITTFVNKSMAKMLGYTVDEMIGKHLFDFMDEKGKKLAEKNLKRRKQGVDEQHDFEFIRKDGRRVYAALETSAIINENAEYEGAIAGVIDITDRKKAEEKIKSSESELRDFFDNANDLIQSVGPDGSFNYVNKKWKDVMGYSDDEVENLHFTDILREDYVSHCNTLFKELSKGKSFDSVDVVFRTKSGEEVVVNGNLNSRIVNGKFVSTRGIFRDVTASKKRMEQLSEARNIINRSSIVAFTWRNSSIWSVEYVSENVEKVFGYTCKDFLSGKLSFEEVIHPDDLDRVSKEVKDASEDKNCNSFEHEPYRIITKDGSIKFVSDKSYIVRNEDGVITHYRGLVEDVTEKQELMNEIVETKNKYTALVEQSNDGIIIVQNKKFSFANKALSKITGFFVDELIGMDFLEIVVDYEKEKLRNRYKKRLNGEPVPDFYETTIKCKDGKKKPVELSAKIINYEDKPAILAFVRDISERKKIEVKLKDRLKYEKGLQEISRELMDSSKINIAVNKSLKHLLEVSGVSRVYFFKNFSDPKDGVCMKQIYEVCAEGVPAEIDNPELQHVPYNPLFKRWYDSLSQNKPIYGLVKDFPESEKEILESQNILSILVLPIFVESTFYGFIGFDEISSEKEWDKNNIYLLQTAAERIGLFIEQKNSNNKLKKSENKFHFLFDSSTDAIFIHDPQDFSIIDVNREACKRFGFTADEMKNFTIDDISDDSMPSLKSKEAEQKIEKIQRGETLTMEWLSKGKTGDTFWHEMKIKLVEIDGKKRILATARDINKRKKAQEALLESEKRFRSVTENVLGVIYRCRPDSKWTMKFISSHIEAISGYPASDFIDNKVRAFADIIHPDDRSMVEETISQATNKKRHFSMEYRIIDNQGDIHWVSEKGQPIFDENDYIKWLDGSIFDITKRKQAGEKLQDKIDELERWKKVTVGREHKMKELKEKIKRLENK